MQMRYVQIEPAIYEIEVSLLPAEVRAFHARLIVYLLAHEGLMKDDCGLMAELVGCSPLEASARLEMCKHLVFRRNGRIFHRKIREDIARAKTKAQIQQIRAVTAAEIRYSEHACSMLQADGKGNRESKGTSLPLGKNNITPITPLARARPLHEILRAKVSDWPAFINLASAFKGSVEQWEKILLIAARAAKKRHPVSYFFAVVKKEMGYKRQSRGGVRTMADLAEEKKKEIEKQMTVKNAG